ncbi:hypothetical protein [Mycolicibacter arupensis]|uniref:Uncharacterized protein n=1 Tax=Mycolicibacter arupensis TaxID=342002 RepID=A0A5C7Y2D7_9MYCO|nr:hypothetical protein [Mycolicibacter arupensis]TXI55940.1 MAG: hypothetical protein E6Q54_11985 [Mycolicibacter arupensis]
MINSGDYDNPNAAVFVATHPDGREVMWVRGSYGGDVDLIAAADALRRAHPDPQSMTALAQAMVEVAPGGTYSAALRRWAELG